MVESGAIFLPAPSPPQPVSPRFVAWFNRIAHISSGLYPAGQKSATLTFNLRFIPSNNVTSATLVVDGQKIPAGATSQQFTWTGATAQKASLVIGTDEYLLSSGSWALFEVVQGAQITHTGASYRLDYPIEKTVAGRRTTQPGGAATKASFELSGPGADLLVGEGFRDLSCVPPLAR
jgi:type VI secretion system protein ImpL